jgi:hypothetical protein
LRALSKGFAVLGSWVVWPVVFFSGYWLANIFLMTGRRCSIEGCDAPDGLAGLLWLAAMFGPPLYLTVRWARKRSQG